ncbi:hypothetical protein TSOC_008995 [Tetrabaena socialis]|uniref:30S ribosomal protein S1 n=1 Tax=Tetrabaena socialis TaxID=47790 RepID=A0A2J7ZX69_9CHLO|nr:hypothetical protein TSOC_008995 [Tetrabaena socialis]|eukprot:PNH04845.1 hypothetical protein TSOC_008995 [Tetrabaena socialis]
MSAPRGLRGLSALSGLRLQPSSVPCRSLATTPSSDPSLGPSTSAPTLPPTLREFQASLRVEHKNFALTKLAAQLSSRVAGEASDQEERNALAARLATRDVTPRQLDTLRLLSRYNGSMPYLRGQTILVKVLSVDAERVVVDTGAYGLSTLPRADVSVTHIHTEGDDPPPVRPSTSDVRSGDILRLRVEAPYSPFGDMQLTAVREDAAAQRRTVWRELRRRMDAAQPVEGRVLNDCPDGWAVGVAGFVALLPYRLGTQATGQRVGVPQRFYIVAMDDGRQLMQLRDANLAQGSWGGGGR